MKDRELRNNWPNSLPRLPQKWYRDYFVSQTDHESVISLYWEKSYFITGPSTVPNVVLLFHQNYLQNFFLTLPFRATNYSIAVTYLLQFPVNQYPHLLWALPISSPSSLRLVVGFVRSGCFFSGTDIFVLPKFWKKWISWIITSSSGAHLLEIFLCV